jgi:hypothetical protein
MAGVLVDSNVLLDLFTDDPTWARWSEARLAEAFDVATRAAGFTDALTPRRS